MHDLDIQIRDYLDATSHELTVDDILYAPVGVEQVRPLRQRSQLIRWRRGWGIAAAAATFVLIAVGLLPLLLPRGPDQPAGTTMPVSTTVANAPIDARPAIWVSYGIYDVELDTFDVWITDPNGDTRSLIASPEDGIWRMCPRFSRSGDYLARVETAEVGNGGAPFQDWVLVVSDFDSTSGEVSNERRFPIRSGEPDCGAWSPIDDVYAYPSPEGSLMLLDATTDDNLNLGDPIGIGLAWSPNGTEIVSSIENEGVMVRSLTDDTDRSFLHRSDYDYSWLGSPEWSPDGTMLAIWGIRYSDDSNDRSMDDEFILVVASDGTVIEEITIERAMMEGPAADGSILTMGPTWSPDGRSILYAISSRQFSANGSSESFSGEVRAHVVADGSMSIIDATDNPAGSGMVWIDDEWLLIVGDDTLYLHSQDNLDNSFTAAALPINEVQELFRVNHVSYAWATGR